MCQKPTQQTYKLVPADFYKTFLLSAKACLQFQKRNISQIHIMQIHMYT